jgi:hypothetical protein
MHIGQSGAKQPCVQIDDRLLFEPFAIAAMQLKTPRIQTLHQRMHLRFGAATSVINVSSNIHTENRNTRRH